MFVRGQPSAEKVPAVGVFFSCRRRTEIDGANRRRRDGRESRGPPAAFERALPDRGLRGHCENNPMKSRRTKKALALSVVVTVASVSGCGPTHTNNPPEPVDHINPPAPDPEPGEVPPPDGPTGEPTAQLPRRGQLVTAPDGCRWVARFDPPDCPPDASCNPPPPEVYPVTCPAWVGGAPPADQVERYPDGGCFTRLSRDKTCESPDDCQPAMVLGADVECPAGR
jgi:hypothetical protein